MNALAQLDSLTTSSCSVILQNIPDAEKKIHAFLTQIERSFKEKVQGLDAPGAEYEAFIKKLFEIERELQSSFLGKLSPEEGFTLLLDTIKHSLPKGVFLTEESARLLLKENPPVSLMSYYDIDTVDTLCEKISPRAAVSLTRHSESDEWKKHHTTLLSSTKAQYEIAPLCVYVKNAEEIRVLAKMQGRTLKPWNVSHSKEVGILQIFIEDVAPELQTPLLLRTAVFLHYAYETAYAGASLQSVSHKYRGDRLLQILSNHRDSFPFFVTANVYDEVLYWQFAIEALEKIIPSQHLTFFRESLACLGHLSSGEKLSCNIVDLLWDINLTTKTGTTEYYQSTQERFYYHGEEFLWYEVLRSTLSIDPKEMQREILFNIHIGDKILTDSLITKNIHATI